ncbi:MAG: LysR family transcriptional regulator [Sutterellaceae bacterium]|nr:LysR family transcriptional regulator [Sutterellaceae bacterium]
MKEHLPKGGIFFSRSLELLLEVAQAKSFSEAANRRGVSQSAISQLMQKLEKELGVTLFERSQRPLKLTKQGQLLVAGIVKPAQEIENLVRDIRKENFIKPSLRLGLIESMALPLAVPLVENLKPHVKDLYIRTESSERLVYAVLGGELDFAVVASPTEFPDSLERVCLFEEPWVCLFPKTIEGKIKSDTWQSLQLCGLPLIQHDIQNASGRLQSAAFGQFHLEFPYRYACDTFPVLFSLIAAGKGWGAISLTGAFPVLMGHYDIKVAPTPQPGLRRRMFLVRRKGTLGSVFELVKDELIKLVKTEIELKLESLIPWARQDFKLNIAEDRQVDSSQKVFVDTI